MKLNRFFGLLILGVLGCSAITACSDDNDTDSSFGPVSSKVKLTLGGIPNAAGGTVVPVWNTGDKAVMYSLGNGKSDPNYASPILPGASTEDFLFTFNGMRNAPSTVVAAYPADAAISCADSKIRYNITAVQNGTPDPVLAGWATGIVNSYEGIRINLKPLYAPMLVKVERGNYSISSVTVKANDGTPLAGELVIDPVENTASASEPTVTVNLPAGVDCSAADRTVVAMVAPVELSEGYTVEISLSTGETLTSTSSEPVKLEPGTYVETGNIASAEATRIAFCGSDRIFILKPDLIRDSYKDAVVWQWDATSIASVLGIKASRCNHIDDCKPVESGKRMLVTSSYNWAVLLDVETGQPVFYTTKATNAHSAELLPGNRVAVACSSGGDAIQIYDISKSDAVVTSADLNSAHGVVWMESKQRLYAIGGTTMAVYRLEDWDTSSPKLVLERSFTSKVKGLHDLTMVDDHTLCVSGQGSWLYNINDDSWKELTLLSNTTALKSVNYNGATGEMWYTDATHPEGSQTWSTHTLHFATNAFGNADASTIRCEDIDIYKVRVFAW